MRGAIGDDSCLNAVAALDCPPPSHPGYVRVFEAAGGYCSGPPLRIYPTVETVETPLQVYSLSNGECQLATSVPGGTFVSLGGALADAEFVLGSEVLR